LWKRGRLKKAARKMVRSSLSTGPGWLKVIMITDKREDPQVAAALNDLRDNLSRLQAAQAKLERGDVPDVDVAVKEIELQIQGLEAKVEVVVRKGLAIDFCSAEDVQVSLDVRDLSDYLDAGWCANAIYRPTSELAAMFPRLSPEDIKGAGSYYQRKPHDVDTHYSAGTTVTDSDADAFGKDGALSASDGEAIEFAKVIEVWDKRDNLIKTMVDGVKCWAKPPYPPPQATTRFYPYFLLAFYEVDGSRHPQSLAPAQVAG
jgi:uncharacterized protein (DUF433 family)